MLYRRYSLTALLAAFAAGCFVILAALSAWPGAAGRLLFPVWGNRSREGVAAGLEKSAPAPRTVMPRSAAPLGDGAVAEAAAKVAPAVVDVHTQGPPIAAAAPRPFFEHPFLRRFFGTPSSPFEGFDGAGEAGRLVPRGTGSGVILSADGHILTNAHVIAGAERVTVRVGERGYDARVVGTDPVSDIAVVKIDPKGRKLPVARLGDSDTVRVGDWAIAVGNPLDVGTTVTLGIVSAVNRKGLSAEGHPLDAVIQTDAAINPGNSGGALANIRGEVIGINEAILSPTGAYAGIGFAIPINDARRIAAALIRDGKVVRPYLGVSYVPLSAIPPEARRQLGIAVRGDEGAVVQQVVPGSPADRAGLQVYDVIREANRQSITGADALRTLISKRKVGDTVALLVSRDGRDRLVTVKLTERPATPRAGEEPPGQGQPQRSTGRPWERVLP